MSTTHATAAAETLRTAAVERYPALKDSVAALGRAILKLREQTDIVLLMAAVDELSMAAKAIHDAAERLHESADAALVKSMSETGCYGFAGAFHSVSLREGVPSVEILDTAAVPAIYIVERPPIPDKRLIAKMLRANGSTANWARLVPGRPGLMRRSNAT